MVTESMKHLPQMSVNACTCRDHAFIVGCLKLKQISGQQHCSRHVLALSSTNDGCMIHELLDLSGSA